MRLVLPSLLSFPGGWVAVFALFFLAVGCAGSDDPIIFGDGAAPGSARRDTGPSVPGFVERDTGGSALQDLAPEVVDTGFSRPTPDPGLDQGTDDESAGEVAAEPDPGPPDPGRDTAGGVVLPTCGEEEIQIEKVEAAHVLIILDRSGSMEGSNWEQAQQAVGDVLAVHGPYIRFGLLLFPHQSGCDVPSQPNVAFALDNGDAIVQLMQQEGTTGQTPTPSALDTASSIFAGLGPGDGAKAVILATDGQPTCLNGCGGCAAVGDGGCSEWLLLGCMCWDEQACVEKQTREAVSTLAQAGVSTYVIGITGSSSARNLLNELADRGGTAKPGDPRYYDTGSATELATALGDIASSVGSCSVEVTPPVGYDFIVVRINGEKVKKDKGHENGWDLLDDDVMQFYGDACNAAAAPDADVTVTYVCKH